MISTSFVRAVVVIVAGFFIARGAVAALTLEIVNDSSQPDTNVYVLLAGSTITASGITFQDLAVPQASVTGTLLSAFTKSGQVVSPFTGRTLDVYTCTISDVSSGLLYFSNGQGVTYSGTTAPTANEAYRFDQSELTYTNGTGGSGDLTSINFLGIPLQYEVFDATDDLVGTRTFTSSLESIVEQFPAGSESAFVATGGGAWDGSSFTNFARILGPPTLIPANSTGSPAPYASFAGYLESLIGQTFTVSGTNSFPETTYNVPNESAGTTPVTVPAYTSTYTYSGTVAGNATTGYTINLTGTTVPPPPATIYPANAAITIDLPTTASGSPTENLDFFIYGAVLNSDSFSLAPGLAAPPAGVTTQSFFDTLAANSVYANAVGDVLSGLNFGYLDGKYGDSGAVWYQELPQSFPFAAARSNPADGFYNSYAALLYNVSDAYGFAFSDRAGRPSPLISFGPTDTLRVTILPDVRLSAPWVSLVGATDTSLTVSWPAVTATGFTVTGYDVTVSPPFAGATTTVPAAAGTISHTITGLASGTPYVVEVVATGTNSANAATVSSNVFPVTYVTTGTTPVPSGAISFDIGFNWATPPAGGAQVSIGGGAPSAINTQTTVQAAAGTTNAYVLKVLNGAGNPIFQSNYYIGLSSDSTPSSYTVSGAFFLEGNAQPLNGGANFPGPYAANLVVGTPFVPISIKERVATGDPTPSPTPPPNPTPTPAPAPAAPQLKVDGRKTIQTSASKVQIKGSATGSEVYAKYKVKRGKVVTKKVNLRAGGGWKFALKPRVKRTVVKFYAENAVGERSGIAKVKVIDRKF